MIVLLVVATLCKASFHFTPALANGSNMPESSNSKLPSIHVAYEICSFLFAKLQRAGKGTDHAVTIGDHYGRFRIWAGNLGVRSKDSLDSRLEVSSHLRDNVLEIFDDLSETLNECAYAASNTLLCCLRTLKNIYRYQRSLL